MRKHSWGRLTPVLRQRLEISCTCAVQPHLTIEKCSLRKKMLVHPVSELFHFPLSLWAHVMHFQSHLLFYVWFYQARAYGEFNRPTVNNYERASRGLTVVIRKCVAEQTAAHTLS
jgi:hypothetical protein